MDANITFILITTAIVLYSAWIVAGQRKTIDKLTDKLMAKDLTEYRRGSIALTDEPKLRKPISFYDDPSIELDSDKVT
jgi:hypothetical protein